MRIVHVITRMIVGGAQENTLLNCIGLARMFGDDVTLLTGPSPGPEGDLLSLWQNDAEFARHFEGDIPEDNPSTLPGERGGAGRLEIRRVETLRRNIHPIRDARAAAAVASHIAAIRPDVVHTHSAKGGIIGRWAAHRHRVPMVVHSVHGAPFHQYQSRHAATLFRRLERWAAPRCHRMISVADAMTDLMVDAGVAPREQFVTIASGMNVEPFLNADRHRDRTRREFNFDADAIVVGKIARLFHLKGHDDLLDGFALAARDAPRLRLLLVGDGILQSELRQRAERLGIADRIRWAGLVPPTRVPAMIGAMDLLCHTSLREGLARALPQTLLAGKPAISFDVDGAREVVIDGKTGRLLPPRDVTSLADAITELAGDVAMRNRMGDRGRAGCRQRFDHREMTRQIRGVYTQQQ